MSYSLMVNSNVKNTIRCFLCATYCAQRFKQIELHLQLAATLWSLAGEETVGDKSRLKFMQQRTPVQGLDLSFDIRVCLLIYNSIMPLGLLVLVRELLNESL